VLRGGNFGDLIHDGNILKKDGNTANCKLMKIKVLWRVRR
jgi:hypothetical protein